MARKRLAETVAEDIDHSQQLAADAELARLRSELSTLKGRYKSALTQIWNQGDRSTIDQVCQSKKARRHGCADALGCPLRGASPA